ncbi:MAG: TonB-dependent receptor [Rhodanobacteraceae bacterium]
MAIVVEAHATATPPAETAPTQPKTLGTIRVTAALPNQLFDPSGISPDISRYQLPQTTVSIGRGQIGDTINFVDTEDALKYFPSLFVRKRNFGDTQAVLETRMWGVNSSARSLVYVDNVPISALISNNNTTGAPRWGMVPPTEIKGIDVLYGPYAAEFPGNSMGGVVLITTRRPQQFEASVDQTGAWQNFDMYGTHHGYGTLSTQATLGDREGRFSWSMSAHHLDSFSQPLFFVTSTGAPTGTTGAFPSVNKLGAPADVVGASGLLHSLKDTFAGTFAFDITHWLRATYRLGYWHNDTRSDVASYLTDAAGAPSFGGVNGFANGRSYETGRQLMNALSFTTHTDSAWNWNAVFTRYNYLEDRTRSPAGVLAGEAFTPNGYIARMGGTGWDTQDVKWVWHPHGAANNVSFGVHHDRYLLNNPTYDADDWMAAPATGNGSLHTDGRGTTSTYALWAQDVWTIQPNLRLTLGARWESWRAYDGFNFAGDTAVIQPQEHARRFSPKAALSWQINPEWSTKFLFGVAYRFPTVSELYQIVSTGDTFSVPNPNLAPEHVRSGDWVIARTTADTELQLSVFQQDTDDALLSQTTFLNNVLTNTVQNVDRVRDRGIELVATRHNAFVPRLTLSNSITYVDSRIMSDPTFESATGTQAAGKHVPYVPMWRDTLRATYHASARVAVTFAARYQSKIYSTLDNTDTVEHVFGTFDPFLTMDLHAHLRLNDLVDLDVGIDNLTNQKYFEYHPFPMRTLVVEGHVHF